MNRKFLVCILIAVFITVTLIPALPAAAQEPEYVLVLPYLDGETFQASPGQEVRVGWLWAAVSPGLARLYALHTSLSFSLTDSNGQVVWSVTESEAEQYWREPGRYDWPPDLIAPMPYRWFEGWRYSLYLPEGTYTLSSTETNHLPINDGYHVVRDAVTGERITPVPSMIWPGTYSYQVTIIVQ
jgi:hypothetical protein